MKVQGLAVHIMLQSSALEHVHEKIKILHIVWFGRILSHGTITDDNHRLTSSGEHDIWSITIPSDAHILGLVPMCQVGNSELCLPPLEAVNCGYDDSVRPKWFPLADSMQAFEKPVILSDLDNMSSVRGIESFGQPIPDPNRASPRRCLCWARLLYR